MDSLTPVVKGILVLDSDGKRLAAKYYGDDTPDSRKQSAFELGLHQKVAKVSARSDAQVLVYERFLVVYKFIADVEIFVLGKLDENELIIAAVLGGLEEAIMLLLRNQVDKRTLLENLDMLLIAIDECVDDGIILEIDSAPIVERASMKGAEKDVPSAEPSLSQAILKAKEQIEKSLRG